MADERDWRAAAVLAVGLLLCGALLMVVGRHLSFNADEWTFALDRRGWDADALLSGHNGHLSLFPAFIYKILFEIVGFAHSWPYRLVLVLLHAGCVVFVYLLARRRFGPWLALFPAGLLLLPGSSNDDLLWAFQIGFVGSLTFGLAALVCLDREERRFDIAATVLVGLSIASSTIGVAFAAGILAELLLTREKRPRLYVALIPFALYAVWLVSFQIGAHETQVQASNIQSVPRYDARAASQGFAGFGNLPIILGALLLAVTSAWLAAKLLRERGLPARAFVGIVGGVGFWTLAALARAQIHDAAATRYIYPSMVFILITVIACLPRIRRVPWLVGVALAAFVAFALVNDYAPLKKFTDSRANLDPLIQVDQSAAVVADREGDPWVAATRDLDYPVLSAAQILNLRPALRQRADEYMVKVDTIEYVAATPLEVEMGEPATVPPAPGLRRSAATVGGVTCTRLAWRGRDGSVDVRLPAKRDLLLLRDGQRDPRVSVRLRRLSEQFQFRPLYIPPRALPEPGSAGVVRIFDDSSRLPWYARIEFSGPIRVCLVPPLA